MRKSIVISVCTISYASINKQFLILNFNVFPTFVAQYPLASYTNITKSITNTLNPFYSSSNTKL